MRTLRWKLLPLVLIALLSGWVASGTTGMRAVVAGDGPVPSANDGKTHDVDLRGLRMDPPRWLGERVRFVVQFREIVPDWNPYLSRFGPVDWLAFSCWADEDYTWDPTIYEDPLTFLFVPRHGELRSVLESAVSHERYEVTAIVREIFLDEPWIEVERMQSLDEHVGEGTILHVGRAREFMRRGQWELALEQYERAMAAPLPAHAAAELDRQIVECQLAREEAVTRGRVRR